jgi:predicted transcriptional regulator
MADLEQQELTALTVQLLSAYVANNQLESGQLAGLIETTRNALAGKPKAEDVVAPEFVGAVTVRKSLGSRDHILSMIDGKPYKSLKRHLSTRGLTPAEYRERYNLPKDYPMVAPGYSEQRREVAKRLGLGRRPAAAGAAAPAAPEAAQAPVEEPAAAPPKATRSRAAAAKASAAPQAVSARSADGPAVKAPRGRPKAAKATTTDGSDGNAEIAPGEAAPAKAKRAPRGAAVPKAASRKREASKPAVADGKPAVRRGRKPKVAVVAPEPTGDAS